VGLDNYIRLAGSTEFYEALQFSILFAVVNVVVCYLLGLGIALLMDKDMPGRAFFRVAFLLPWITPSIVSVVSWRWLIADQNAPVILMTIWTINDFETPWLITQGGPSGATENLILLAHRLTFARNQIGLGSAVSFVTFLILMALALTMLRQQRDDT
jgi:ABC-type sugar transport system permease subunit